MYFLVGEIAPIKSLPRTTPKEQVYLDILARKKLTLQSMSVSPKRSVDKKPSSTEGTAVKKSEREVSDFDKIYSKGIFN